MDKETNRMKLAYWSGVIKESKSSGMKIREWCRANQISIRKYYYWHKKVMHSSYAMAVANGLLPDPDESSHSLEPVKGPAFTELLPPDKNMMGGQHRNRASGISIRFNDATILLDEEFSERELLKVLKVMNHVQ